MEVSVDMLAIPVAHGVIWWVAAILFSGYHGSRAILNQRRWVEDENKQRAEKGLSTWTLPEQVYIYRAHDCLFHVVCCLSGFVSAYALSMMFHRIVDFADIGVGSAIFMSFLGIVAIAGIAGVLPPLLLYGRLWGRFSGQSN
jgi:hypothetical protein